MKSVLGQPVIFIFYFIEKPFALELSFRKHDFSVFRKNRYPLF